MEQLRLLELEVIVVIELDEHLRDELVILMAGAIVTVHQTETEIDDE